MLILRNRVLSFGIVQVWVVPPCYMVDLLTLRYGLCRTAGGLFADRHEWYFQVGKRSDKFSTILKEGRFADA